jgi:hypothetical protein
MFYSCDRYDERLPNDDEDSTWGINPRQKIIIRRKKRWKRSFREKAREDRNGAIRSQSTCEDRKIAGELRGKIGAIW